MCTCVCSCAYIYYWLVVCLISTIQLVVSIEFLNKFMYMRSKQIKLHIALTHSLTPVQFCWRLATAQHSTAQYSRARECVCAITYLSCFIYINILICVFNCTITPDSVIAFACQNQCANGKQFFNIYEINKLINNNDEDESEEEVELYLCLFVIHTENE